MQLVGQTCVHCRERVTREGDARFCPKCDRAVHLACSKRALSASPSGCCRACGAPAKERGAEGNKPRRSEVTERQSYRIILLGVAMMICGILGSIIFSGAGVNGPLVTAGGAILGGAVLVAVGFLYATRR